MTPDEIEILLSKALDGELQKEEKVQLDQYFAENGDAENPQAHWKQYGEWLRDIPEVKTSPPEAWEKIHQAIEHQQNTNPDSRKTNILHFPFIKSIAAAIILLASIAFYFSQQNYKSSITQTASTNTKVQEEGSSYVEFVDTDIPGASSVVYVDDESGWTIVWVVEPEPS